MPSALRRALVSASLLWPVLFFAQQPDRRSFFDADWYRCDSAEAMYEMAWFSNNGDPGGRIVAKDSAGNLISERNYSHLASLVKHGTSTWYHPNGAIKSVTTYSGGEMEGERLTFYENGQLRRREVYTNLEMTEGHCFTRAGKDTTWFEYDVAPVYSEGNFMLGHEISSRIRYPEAERKADIEGRVVIMFIVTRTGEVTRIQVDQSAVPAMDAEALRVVASLKGKWSPAREEGVPVDRIMKLPVQFRLE
jgi:TonB family protein